MKKHKRGFTLIELMIVIAIMSILAAILIPNFMRARAQGAFTQCQSNCKNLATSISMYGIDNQGHFPSSLSMVTPAYMRVIPTCASAVSDTYTAGYTSNLNPDAYTFYCSGSNHTVLGVPQDFPQYNAATGLVPRP